MEHVTLGGTGLRVSRVCLGMMSFGDARDRPWVLDEDDAEPIVRRAVEGGITFFDTADVYNGGAERGRHRAAAAEALRQREEYVVATKVCMADDARRERRRALAQAHPRVDRRVARSGSGSTTSTCTRSTAGTRARRSRRRWRRCTTSSVGQGPLHRREQHVRVAVREGAVGRAADGRVRLDAEPLQPRLPRGGAGDDPAVPRPGRRRDPVEPARARAARREPDARGRAADRRAPRRTRSATRSTRRTSTSTSSTGPPRSRASAASRPRRSRSRGCCTSRA